MFAPRLHALCRDDPGPAVAVLLDLARKEGAVHCCYVWAAEAYGARDVILCAPVVVGERGVRRVLTVPLDPGRRVTVDRGIDFLSAVRR